MKILILFLFLVCNIGTPIFSQNKVFHEAKYLDSDTRSYDRFGFSVSVSNDFLLIGATGDDDKGSNSGSAYIVENQNGTLVRVAKLIASDGAASDNFGYDIAIKDTTAAISARWDDDNGNNSGSAYIFEKDVNNNWNQITKLLASDGAENDLFGKSIALSENILIVGAPNDDDNGENSGSAYIFEKDANNNWNQTTKLLADDGAFGDSFGSDVAIAGDWVIIGSPNDDEKGNESGSIYFFNKNGSDWNQLAKVTASDGNAEDKFGSVVSITNQYAIIGATGDDDNGSGSGSAYILEKRHSGWEQLQKLTPDDGINGDFFGRSVSISNQYAIIGASGDDDGGNNVGASYIFEVNALGNWNQITKLIPSDGEPSDGFGQACTISEHDFFIGVWEDDDKGLYSGSIYRYSTCPRYYEDIDNDGYGNAAVSIDTCGFKNGYVDNYLDCNDLDSLINVQIYYKDNDNDGFGNLMDSIEYKCNDIPNGYIDNADDCNDQDEQVNPNIFYYEDADDDNFGNASISLNSCESIPNNYVDNNLDCDDSNASINPGVLYYKDADADGYGNHRISINNCNPIPSDYVDNALDCDDANVNLNIQNFYKDVDGDGYGNPLNFIIDSCNAIIAGYVDNNLDCDDSNASINPGVLYYEDADGDGYGNPHTSINNCSIIPSNYVANALDCNDSDSLITIYGCNTGYYFVNTIDDYNDGVCDSLHCSLREAINNSNGDGIASEIYFNFENEGYHEIKVYDVLPTLFSFNTPKLTIDATLLSDSIIINGENLPNNYDAGLYITSDNIEIYGLTIKGFWIGINLTYADTCIIGAINKENILIENNVGISVLLSNNIKIANNYIGTKINYENRGNYLSAISILDSDNISLKKNIIGYNGGGINVGYGVNAPYDSTMNTYMSQNIFFCNSYYSPVQISTPHPTENYSVDNMDPVNPPTIDSNFTILTQVSGSSLPFDTIEVYLSDESKCEKLNGQASLFLGNTIANSNGDWTLNGLDLQIGDKIVANATKNLNTSEFSSVTSVNLCSTNYDNIALQGQNNYDLDLYSSITLTGNSSAFSGDIIKHNWYKFNVDAQIDIINHNDGTATIQANNTGYWTVYYEAIDEDGCIYRWVKTLRVNANCPASNGIITVTNTNDSGVGSLRDAIFCASNNTEIDNIHFDIPGSGPHKIFILSELPGIYDEGVKIDVSTQSSFYPGIVILSGDSLSTGHALNINRDNIEIYGLHIDNFPRTAINTQGIPTLSGIKIGAINKGNIITRCFEALQIPDDAIIEGNYIGTDTSFNDLGNQTGFFLGRVGNPHTVVIKNNYIMYNEVGITENPYEFYTDNIPTISRNIFSCNSYPINLRSSPNDAPNISIVTNTITGTSQPKETIEIFLADTECFSTCQGSIYIGTTIADNAGNWSLPTPTTFNAGDVITVTGTDTLGFTSEFSNCYTVLPDECFLAESLPVNDQACSSVGIVSDLKQMTNSTPSPYNDCNNTYAGNDAWYKIQVPRTGNFLVRTNTSNTVVPVIEVYSACGNPAQPICTTLDTLPYIMTFENYDTNDIVYLRVWDKNNTVVNSGNTALLHLSAHKLDSLQSNWDICDYENLILQNPTNLSRREANTFILSYEPNTPQSVIDADSIAFTDMMEMEKKKSCSCGEEELQLWSTDKPVELDGRRKYAKSRGSVDTTNYNYIFETVEFQVNSYATGKQYNTDVAMDAEGNFAMVWLDEQRGHNYGRVYLSSGNPITVEFQIGTTTKTQYSSQVAMDNDGDFVVVWHEKDETDAAAKYEVKALIYDKIGDPKFGPFTVSVQPNDNATNPNVAMDSEGNFVVVWHVGTSVFARRFNAIGNAQGTIIELDPSIENGVEPHPSIAINDNGDFIVVWAGDDTDKKGIYGQRFNATGSPIGSLIEANTQQEEEQNYPDAILRNDGSFVIAWESYEEEGLGLDYGVFAQQFDITGTKVGTAFQVNSYTQDAQRRPTIASFNDNSFLIAWSSFGQDGFAEGIYAKLFDATGTPIPPDFDDSERGSGTNEFRMNFYNDPQQDKPKTATNGENIFMGAWEDGANDGSLEGIFAQRYESITVDNAKVFKPIGTATPSILLGDQLEYAPTPYHPGEAVKKAKVAIIDTGVDNLHNLLNAAIWNNPEENDTDNCLIGDEIGYDFVNRTGIPNDVDGHGTQVNGILTNGFDAEVKLELMNLKFHELNKGNVFDAICAIYYAVDNGADILNLSWGFEASEEPAILKKALQYASDNDVLIVTTAGNTSKNNDLINKYPANLDIPNMIVVTSYYYKQLNNEIKLSNYASYGQNNVDIAAYGYVETASISGEKADAAGTSMAAPAVARTAATIKGLYSVLTAGEIKDCILSTAKLVNTLSNRVKTGGILDHDAALACAQTKMEEILAAACAASNLNISSSITDETCAGNDGSITLNITGNEAVTNILWSTGETTQNISQLSAGTYEVTVTDGARCMQSVNLNLMDDCANAPCQSDIVLNNLNLTNNIYHSENTIVSNSAIAAGNNVTFKAAQSITLNAGFHATTGSQFWANIEACPAAFNQEILNTQLKVNAPETTTSILSAKIYPNPTQDILNVSVTKPENGFGLILYNVMGQKLNTWQIKNNQTTISVADLSAGIYFLQIDSEVIKKFIVSKK